MCFPSYLMLTSDALILLQLFFDVSGEVTGSGHNGKYGAVPHSVVTQASSINLRAELCSRTDVSMAKILSALPNVLSLYPNSNNLLTSD